MARWWTGDTALSEPVTQFNDAIYTTRPQLVKRHKYAYLNQEQYTFDNIAFSFVWLMKHVHISWGIMYASMRNMETVNGI